MSVEHGIAHLIANFILKRDNKIETLQKGDTISGSIFAFLAILFCFVTRMTLADRLAGEQEGLIFRGVAWNVVHFGDSLAFLLQFLGLRLRKRRIESQCLYIRYSYTKNDTESEKERKERERDR